MLKLGQAPEEVRVDLHGGAFLILDPITPKMRRRALRAARAFMEREGIAGTDDVTSDQWEDVGEIISRELIRMGAREWSGIGDAKGTAIALTPDQATRIRSANDADRPTGTIDLLLADIDEFERLDAGYIRPDVVRRAEKNASSGSPNGTSAAATPGSAIVSSAAAQAGKRGPRRKAAAKPARTASTRSRAKPAKASGKR